MKTMGLARALSFEHNVVKADPAVASVLEEIFRTPYRTRQNPEEDIVRAGPSLVYARVRDRRGRWVVFLFDHEYVLLSVRVEDASAGR